MRAANRTSVVRGGRPSKGGMRGATGLAAPTRQVPGARGWRDERGRPSGKRRQQRMAWWRPSRSASDVTGATATGHRPAPRPLPLPAPPTQGWRAERPPRRARANPAMRRLRRTVALAALVTLALAALMIWLLTAPTWQLRHLRIEGTHDPAVLAAVRALPLTDCNVFRCDLARDMTLIARIPAIARADARIEWPDTLALRVAVRSPLLVWRVAGQPYVVASDGVLLGPATAADVDQLPHVDDPSGAALGGTTVQSGARVPAALVGVAAQLLGGLPEVIGHTVTLRYTEAAGLVAADGQGLDVAFGDPTRPPSDAPQGVGGQLAELRAVLNLLNRQGQRAGWIDLRWGWHPVYRLAGT